MSGHRRIWEGVAVAACAGLILRRGLEGAAGGRPGLAPVSRALTRRGPAPYAEQWSLALGYPRQGWHFLLDLILCNPTDLSYEVETTATYISVCYRDGSGGWQLLDRYSLRHFHASPERGEVLVGMRENPRCLLRLRREEGGFRLSVSGCLERHPFLRRGFQEAGQDISWDLHILFREAHYPDALLDSFPRLGRAIRPCGASFLCSPSEVLGMFKVNEVIYEAGAAGEPLQAWFLQRWGSSPCAGEREMFCLAGKGGEEDAAVLRTPLPLGEPTRPHPGSSSGSNLFLFLRRGGRRIFLRNTPLHSSRLRMLAWETGFGTAKTPASPLRVELVSRSPYTRAAAQAILPARLEALLPGTHGQCVLRSWLPCGSLTVERSGKSSRLDAQVIIEGTWGGWWDCVAEFVEIPVDLENP